MRPKIIILISILLASCASMSKEYLGGKVLENKNHMDCVYINDSLNLKSIPPFWLEGMKLSNKYFYKPNCKQSIINSFLNDSIRVKTLYSSKMHKYEKNQNINRYLFSIIDYSGSVEDLRKIIIHNTQSSIFRYSLIKLNLSNGLPALYDRFFYLNKNKIYSAEICYVKWNSDNIIRFIIFHNRGNYVQINQYNLDKVFQKPTK